MDPIAPYEPGRLRERVRGTEIYTVKKADFTLTDRRAILRET